MVISRVPTTKGYAVWFLPDQDVAEVPCPERTLPSGTVNVKTVSLKAHVRAELSRVPGAVSVARITLETIRICLRYRVTGLASEAGFFALLSLPPLVLGLFGGVGYIGRLLGPETVNQIVGAIQEWAERFLTDTSITTVLLPTVKDVLGTGRFDLISVGFLLSLWSGSRALNVFVDTISIMYGQSGERGIVRTRALSFSLYVVSIVVGVVVIPLVLIGPSLLGRILPDSLAFLRFLYWPVVTFLAVANLTTLYNVSTPRRSQWRRDIPGAVLTLVIWLLASFIVRGAVASSLQGKTSIYGPLSAPIVLLIWLYALAIAVLIGAALNAAIRQLWPVEEKPSYRASMLGWLGGVVGSGKMSALGRRKPRPAHVRPLTPMPGADFTKELDGQFGGGDDDQIMSVRTRSG